MGAFNELVLNRVGNGWPAEIQFKYGLRWQIRYRIGDRIDWHTLRRPKSAEQRVLVDGVGQDDTGAYRYFAIEIVGDVIVRAWEIAKTEWERLEEETNAIQSKAERVRQIKLVAPSSVVLVSDQAGGEIPSSMNDEAISATSTCVAVGCLAEKDGETEFMLGALSELERCEAPSYEGELKTPTRRIVIRSVLGGELLGMPVEGDATRVKIWTGCANEPNQIVVAVSRSRSQVDG